MDAAARCADNRVSPKFPVAEFDRLDSLSDRDEVFCILGPQEQCHFLLSFLDRKFQRIPVFVILLISPTLLQTARNDKPVVNLDSGTHAGAPLHNGYPSGWRYPRQFRSGRQGSLLDSPRELPLGLKSTM